jgi:hypothetical protein
MVEAWLISFPLPEAHCLGCTRHSNGVFGRVHVFIGLHTFNMFPLDVTWLSLRKIIIIMTLNIGTIE